MLMYMASSEFFVYQVIKQRNGEKMTICDICELSPMPLGERTVHRALKRLIASGRIRRDGGGQGNARGYIYYVCD